MEKFELFSVALVSLKAQCPAQRKPKHRGTRRGQKTRLGIKNAINGLKNQIERLNKVISNSDASDEVVKAATELRNTIQKQKDEISEALINAENKIKDAKKIP